VAAAKARPQNLLAIIGVTCAISFPASSVRDTWRLSAAGGGASAWRIIKLAGGWASGGLGGGVAAARLFSNLWLNHCLAVIVAVIYSA